MSKVIIKGINEDGKIDAECKSTAVLVTELIERLPKMCEADIRKELEEIRLSVERDTRIRQTYAHILKEHKTERKVAADTIVKDAVAVIKRCAEEHKDMDAVMTICKLCKAIAGDEFEVKAVAESREEE